MSRLVTRCTTGVHPPPPWGGGKVDVQVTPVLGTDWKGLYANAHCAALASEETNHTRKNGVCVSSSPPLWGQQPHAASLHHGLCLHEPCATRACSPHVPRPTKLLGEQGCIGWGACCGFAGHTVVLTLNGSHPGELHYKMAKGQCDTRGAWTSARPRAAHARASHNTQLPNQTAWRGAVWNPTPPLCGVCGLHSTPPVEGVDLLHSHCSGATPPAT
jgi:hypothetical protein